MKKYIATVAVIVLIFILTGAYSYFSYLTKGVYERDLKDIFSRQSVSISSVRCKQIGSFRVAECKFKVDFQNLAKNSMNLKLNQVGFTEDNMLYPTIYGNPETKLKVGDQKYCDIGQQSDPESYVYYDAKWQQGNITTRGKGPEPLTYTNSIMIVNKNTGNACMLLFIAFG